MSYGRTFHVSAPVFPGDVGYYTAGSGTCQPQIRIFSNFLPDARLCVKKVSVSGHTVRLRSSLLRHTRRKLICFPFYKTL